MNKRLQTVLDIMKRNGRDGLVISKGTDIKYLTGFSGEYGTAVLLLTENTCYFVTDSRFAYQAEQETTGLEVVVYGAGLNYFGQVGQLVADCQLTHCAFFGSDLSYDNYQDMLLKAPQTKFIREESYVDDLRAVKTPEEIEIIQEACRISERSFYALLDVIKPGVTEIDIANELEYQFRSRGGSGFCFETIVASGPNNGANCHATASARKIEMGDFVTIDFGTYYHGYCSDITRTVAVGKAKTPELYKMFDVVRRAKDAGEKSLKPGLAMSELHQNIFGVVENGGYTIPHGPGHSFGLEIHEYPYIGNKSTYRLKPGVIHTIEPGIYIPGIGGVRQEDDYLITEDGYQRLTNITDALITL
nr:Xaa-Pro peptidase family protein [uncultured Clostridium sp.]